MSRPLPAAAPRAGCATTKLKSSLPASGVGVCHVPRWGFTGSCFVSRAGRMLWSQGRGHLPGWGALQGSPPARLGMALEGFENSLQWASEALRKGRVLLRDPLGSVSKGEGAAQPELPSLHRCLGGCRLHRLLTNRGMRLSICLSVCRPAPVPPGGSV